MTLRLPRIYPITDRRLSGLPHAEQVRELIAGGAGLIQLREKKLSPREFLREAATALTIARGHGVPLIINDRVDIAMAVGAAGVHLGQDDLPPKAARRLLGNQAIIGFSTHDVEQARLASDLPIDYLAVGPIFETSTKEMPDPVIGLEGLRQVRLLIRGLPLVAIGGITIHNAREVFEAGADSVAVIGALFVKPREISLRLKEMLETAEK